MNALQVKNKKQSERITRPSFFSSTSIFPKLTINQPNDKYEQEADAMAEKVMTKPISDIQRTCASCAEEEEALQTKPLVQRQEAEEEEEALQTKPDIQRQEEEEDEPVQAKSNGNGTQAPPDLQNKLQSTKGSGAPLPSSTNQHMSNAFGYDFSNVRVHTGQTASNMNQSIQAKAFTHGSDIYMNEGQYNPNSASGQKLLAHELTHVVQQSTNNVSTKLNRKSDSNKSTSGTKSSIIFREVEEGPECSRGRNVVPLPQRRSTFRGERGFATLPRNGHPGPGGFLVRNNSATVNIRGHWQEQISDPSQRPPGQRRRRPGSPRFYMRFSGWADSCRPANIGSPASTVRSGNLAMDTDHTVNFQNLIPGRYGLHIIPSTSSPEMNRIITGHYSIT